MKPPDEIKKALECRSRHLGEECRMVCKSCDVYVSGRFSEFFKDAIAYITKLEQRLAQVERERDAAVHDLHVLFSENGHTCMICDVEKTEPGCMFDCDHQRKWRGVCAENSKEDEANEGRT